MSIFNTKRMTGMTSQTVEHFVLGAGVFAKNFVPGTDTYESAKKTGKLLGATLGGGEFKAAKVGHYSQVDGVPENTSVQVIFTGHYDPDNLETPPYKIYWPKEA